MLNPQVKSQFVTRYLTNAAGEQYKVVFLVSLVNGEVKAQIVSAELISVKRGAASATSSSASTSLFLPLNQSTTAAYTAYTPAFTGEPIISLLSKFFFFNSQPTRAPSFA